MAVNPPPIKLPDIPDPKLRAFLKQLKDSFYLLWDQTGSGTGVTPLASGGTGASTASAARTNFGLGTIATQDANAVDIDGGAIDGSPVGANSADTGAFTDLTANTLNLDKTVTPAGTTGSRTINKPAGTVNFGASDDSLVVTNSLVTTSSIVLATVATDDAMLTSVLVVAGSGSFTLHANAAATAETRVNFLVVN